MKLGVNSSEFDFQKNKNKTLKILKKAKKNKNNSSYEACGGYITSKMLNNLDKTMELVKTDTIQILNPSPLLKKKKNPIFRLFPFLKTK